MAREVRKEEAMKFIRKAEEFYDTALESYQKERFSSTVLNASQSIIMANDALCIFYTGKRPSKDHREAVKLHLEASIGKENKKDIIKDALEKRGQYGYTEKSAGEKEANLLLVRSKRFMEWVRGRIE